MSVKSEGSPISANKGKLLPRVHGMLLLLAFAGGTSGLASFPGTFHELGRQPAAVRNTSQIPTGYILPAQFDHTLSVKDLRAGDAIEARIMQEVPLPNRKKIPFRSVLKGSVVRVTRTEDETGVDLTVRFDVVSHRGRNTKVATSLRAIASHLEVRDAQLPVAGFDEAFPRWANTVQIGGDIRYGDGHSVRNRWNETVGKAVLGGVLVHAKANSALGCEGPAGGEDHPQALWLFSADACGVYGLPGVELIHNGQNQPVGDITLGFKKANMKLRAGTGLLLGIVSEP